MASAALLTAAGIALVVRIAAIAAPLGIDQGLWASAVRGMSQGQLLYTDVWEQRPPGIYLTYLLAFKLFGWTTAAVAWLDVVASAITVVLLWLVGRRLDGPLTGAAAAFLYAVFTNPAGLYGYGGLLERSVCETFIVACIAAAALCAAPLRERDSVAAAAGLGLCCGLAVVFKPNAALYFPALIVWVMLYRETPSTLASLWRPGAAAIAGALLPSVIIVAWLWQNGSLGDARTAVIDFNRWYVASGFDPVTYALAFKNAVGLRMKTDALWVSGAVASVVAVWRLAQSRRLPQLPGLGLLWGAATVVVIVVNGARLFNSYFIQAFAPLCLMAAWLFASELVTRMRYATVLRGLTVVAMVLALARHGYAPRAYASTMADFAALTGGENRTAYLERFGGYANQRGYSARANEELALYVNAHTRPDERIFLFGVNGADVYFVSDRLSAHRFLRVNFFFPDDFPDPEFNLTAVTRDLEARRPRYVIFENLHANSAIGRAVSGVATDPRVLALLTHYDLETVIEDFTLYRRRD